MYEAEIFKVGVWTGYFLTILGIFMTYAIVLNWENDRKHKYLVEINGLNAYEKWKKSKGWTLIKKK